MVERTKTKIKYLQNLILLELVFVTLYFNPFIGLDPYNFPKMTLLFFFVGISFFYLQRIQLKDVLENSWVYLGFFLWIAALGISLLVNPEPLTQKLYGSSGRNQGFITLLCFAILTLQSMQASTLNLVNRVRKAILSVGLVLIPYSFLQYFGFDIPSILNIYNQMPIGTLGNPDFNSVALSFIGIACISTIFYHSKNFIQRIFFVAYFCAILFLIHATQAAQGFWTLFIGFAVIFYSHFHANLKLNAKRIISLAAVAITFFVFLGMLSLGPLLKLNEIGAVRVRIYYWMAGICAGNKSPIFGIGFDRFGDWYRRCRPEQAFNWDQNRVTDASHNIYLDYYVTGGLLILLAYLFLLIATVRKIVSLYKGSAESVRKLSLLVAVFIAFLGQGLISINQIGIAIWGWIFMGLILGIPIDEHIPTSSKGRNRGGSTRRRNPSTIVSTSFAVIIFITSTLIPPINSAQEFRNALKQGSLEQLESSLFKWPIDRSRVIYGIQILQESGRSDRARIAIVEAVKVFPDDYSLWQTYKSLFLGTAREDFATVQLNRLDPRILIETKRAP